MKPLVLASEDRDLLAFLPFLEDITVFRAPDPWIAIDFAREIRGGGVPAVGPDWLSANYQRSRPLPRRQVMLLHAPKPGHPPWPISWVLAWQMGIEDIFELPAEIDWVRARLGVPVRADLIGR